jgi:hypothetical protein
VGNDVRPRRPGPRQPTAVGVPHTSATRSLCTTSRTTVDGVVPRVEVTHERRDPRGSGPVNLSSYSPQRKVHRRRHGLRAFQCVGLPVVLIFLAPAATGADMVGDMAPKATSADMVGAQTTQRGFALPTWTKGGYDGPQVEQSLREMVEVGATWVQLIPTWYQQTTNASVIARSPNTLSDAGLERAITLAHQHGLKVLLKPHVDVPNASRSTIRPDNRGAWFTSYTAFISHYAEMAARTGVEQFAVGTELASISDDRAAWLQVIQGVRAQYHDTLVYAAEPGEFDRVPFWDAVDLIGIDAYWPLSEASTTDMLVLEQSWDSIRAELAAFSAQHGRKILFTEVGYTSQVGTTTHPYDWTLSSTPSQAEQAAAYQALLEAVSGEPWWEGVYWWVWNALPDNGKHTLDYSPRGKAAEKVIRSWWAT